VTDRYPQDRLQVIGWAAGEFEGHGHVSGSGRDQLVEMTVTGDEVALPSAVDVSALSRQHQQGRVYQQFLVPAALITPSA